MLFVGYKCSDGVCARDDDDDDVMVMMMMMMMVMMMVVVVDRWTPSGQRPKLIKMPS